MFQIEMFFKIKKITESSIYFFMALIFLFFLSFLDGGASLAGRGLVLVLPLFLLLIGLVLEELDFKKLICLPNLLFFVFVVLAGVSVFGSVSLLRSLPSFFVVLAMFLFFQIFLMAGGKKNFRWLAGLVLIVAFGLSLVSFYYLLPGVDKPISGDNLVWARYGHSHLADYLLLSIPFCFALFWTAKEKKASLGWGILLAFFLGSMLLTFSRGAWVVLSIALVFLIFRLPTKQIWKKTLGWVLILSPIVMIGIFSFFSLQGWALKARESQPQHWLVKQVVKPKFYSGRLEYWRQVVEGFKEKPIKGWGVDNFKLTGLYFQNAPMSWSRYAHNFYLQVLVEVGIFGFLALLGFLGASFMVIWPFVGKSKDPLVIGAFGAVLASALHSLIDYDWYFPAVFLTFLLILANLLCLASKQNQLNILRFLLSLRGPMNIGPWQSIGIASLQTPRNDKNSQTPRNDKHTGVLLFFLSFLCFLFFTLQLMGQYFLIKKDYVGLMSVSPWLALNVCKSSDVGLKNEFLADGSIRRKITFFSLQEPLLQKCLGDWHFSFNQQEKAIGYMHNLVLLEPLESAFYYEKIYDFYDLSGEEEEKRKMVKFLALNLEKADKKEIFNKSFGKLCYKIGKEYFDEGDFAETAYWWKKAVRFLPDWSYSHIELASLYFSLGNNVEAGKVLTSCLQFKYPKVHCQEYLDLLSKGEFTEPPGFWEKTISAIPDN